MRKRLDSCLCVILQVVECKVRESAGLFVCVSCMTAPAPVLRAESSSLLSSLLSPLYWVLAERTRQRHKETLYYRLTGNLHWLRATHITPSTSTGSEHHTLHHHTIHSQLAPYTHYTLHSSMAPYTHYTLNWLHTHITPSTLHWLQITHITHYSITPSTLHWLHTTHITHYSITPSTLHPQSHGGKLCVTNWRPHQPSRLYTLKY